MRERRADPSLSGMRTTLALALALLGCTTETTTNIYAAATTSDGGGGASATGGAGGTTTTSTGGGGLGDVGGGGGTGGAPCVPKACADIHGVCGPTDDGCGETIDCPVSDCGVTTNIMMWCDEDAGLCSCSTTGGNYESIQICMQNDDAKSWCGDGPCDPYYCGPPPQAQAPERCAPIVVSTIDQWVWCCRAE